MVTMDDDVTTAARPGDDVDAADAGQADTVAADRELAGPDDEANLARRLGWAKAAILAAALTFLGFAIGMVATRDRPPGEGSVEVGFYQDMLTHHAQALGIATLVVANGESPTVRSYASEVLTFQGFETGVMTQALDDWGYSPTERSDEAMAWMGMGVPVEQMSGLLTDEQMDRLRDAQGAGLDARFLDLVAEHHRGGLHMALYAAENAGDSDVRELAARIARNQAKEINEYRMIAERLGYDIEIERATVPAEIAGDEPSGRPG
jgi:uncharacterized protein (DUF305 family)